MLTSKETREKLEAKGWKFHGAHEESTSEIWSLVTKEGWMAEITLESNGDHYCEGHVKAILEFLAIANCVPVYVVLPREVIVKTAEYAWVAGVSADENARKCDELEFYKTAAKWREVYDERMAFAGMLRNLARSPKEGE